MLMSVEDCKLFLDLADEVANSRGGCCKVNVGSAIVDVQSSCFDLLSTGANITMPASCKSVGCQRIALYGEDSKNHRLPADCRSLHSEIDAICRLNGAKITKNTVILITRYPCESCAKAIVSAGIKTVVYGRGQEISEQTKQIFESKGTKVIWLKDWKREDTTR